MWWIVAIGCLSPPLSLPGSGYVECNPSRFPPLANGICDAITPRAVVFPSDAADVAAAVRYAGAHNLTLSYRSGGHSYTCASLREDSLHLNLAYLDTLEVDEDALEATLGVGLASRAGAVEELCRAQHPLAPPPPEDRVGAQVICGDLLAREDGARCRVVSDTLDSGTARVGRVGLA